MLTQVPEEESDPEGQFSDDGLPFSPPPPTPPVRDCGSVILTPAKKTRGNKMLIEEISEKPRRVKEKRHRKVHR